MNVREPTAPTLTRVTTLFYSTLLFGRMVAVVRKGGDTLLFGEFLEGVALQDGLLLPSLLAYLL